MFQVRLSLLSFSHGDSNQVYIKMCGLPRPCVHSVSRRMLLFLLADKTSYMTETTLHVIFSCQNPPLLLTYDTFMGVHSLWLVREARKEVHGLSFNSDSCPLLTMLTIITPEAQKSKNFVPIEYETTGSLV